MMTAEMGTSKESLARFASKRQIDVEVGPPQTQTCRAIAFLEEVKIQKITKELKH